MKQLYYDINQNTKNTFFDLILQIKNIQNYCQQKNIVHLADSAKYEDGSNK